MLCTKQKKDGLFSQAKSNLIRTTYETPAQSNVGRLELKGGRAQVDVDTSSGGGECNSRSLPAVVLYYEFAFVSEEKKMLILSRCPLVYKPENKPEIILTTLRLWANVAAADRRKAT